MKHFILTTLLFITIISSNLNAQQISSTAYNKAVIHEDFNQEGDFFPIVTTADNYFILDKGDYLLSRNNEESEYAIIANTSSVTNFTLKTAVRIGPSKNKKASVGIIIKAQQDGKGAIIFEINKKGEYRIKQLIGDTYKTLSGLSKQEGWVRNKSINGVDEHNFLEIRTENNIYDVYVNSNYLTTFFAPDYTSGSCGLIISSRTKARVSYYYVNAKGGNNPVASYVNENTPSINATIEELNKKIVTLETNNATLNSLNTEVRGSQDEKIANLNTKNTDLAGVTIEQEKEIASLNRSITNLKNSNATIEELEKINTDNAILINNLKAEKNALTTKITSITSKNTDLAAVTIEQEKEIASLNNSATSSNSSLTNLSTKNTELNSKINSLNTKNSELAAVTIEQEKEIASLNNSATSSNSSLANLSTKNTELNNKINSLNTKNSELAAVTIEQEKVIASLNNSATSSNSSLTNLSTKNTELNNKIELLNSKNTDLAAVTIEQVKEIKALTTTVSNLKSKRTNTSASNKKLTTEISALKQKIILEKSVSTALTNDLNITKKSKQSTSKIVSKQKQEINALKKSNTTLTSNLSAEKIAHKKTKNGLSKSITTKVAEIKALEAQLSTNKQQLKSAKENGALAKEYAKNAATLSVDLKKANKEVTTLQASQNKQNSIVKDLTSQLSLLKAKQLGLNAELQALNKKLSNLETTNTELKELFILKDFEVNGVKPSDLTKQTTTYTTPKELKGNSKIYAVQFGVFMQVQPYSALKGMDEVWYETTEHGTYVYLSGQFKSPQEATAHKNSLATLGYPNAFVVTLTK